MLTPSRLCWRLARCWRSLAHPRHNRAGQRGLAGQLAFHKGVGFHASQAALERQHVHLDAQLISGHHRAAELGLLNARKDRQLLLAVRNLVHHDDGPGLCHRLNHQHAGHDRIVGKVALKKGLVHGHILDGYQALAALELNHSVDQQKRVAVRKQSQDLLDIKCHAVLQLAAGVSPRAPLDYIEARIGRARPNRPEEIKMGAPVQPGLT